MDVAFIIAFALGAVTVIQGGLNKEIGMSYGILNASLLNNFFSLLEIAISSITKYSIFPVKLFINFGFICSFFSILIAIIFFIYKLLFWNSFELGIAPLVIGVFFLSSVQIFILGFIGRYISFLMQYQKNLPLVIEKERINFD